jgi:hypothetical protein
MTSPDDRAYAARLGDVLRQRSVPALRAFRDAQAGKYGDEQQVEAIRAQSDAELEMILHRMTLARADLAGLHAESERWLAGQAGPGPRPPGRPTGETERGPGSNGHPRRRRPPRS